MDIRSQVSVVFHLDKCIGCSTCTVVCKNVWTDRRGAEYMWWNNVETKPGTGYPTRWEDQETYRGGWELDEASDEFRLRLQGRAKTLGNLWHNPRLPVMDDYYEPWTYDYGALVGASETDDPPTARPLSMISGQPIDTVDAGPNWDGDLGGSRIYAANDPNLDGMSESERAQIAEIDEALLFSLPRMCNHCLNPSCVAACPAGAIYKRGEDGVVLASHEQCRSWRMCMSSCPYKKVYFNWLLGKAEKCHLCYPQLETGQTPACFQACVGRARYLGLLLYDADRIEEAAKASRGDLVEAQRNVIVDPFDPAVTEAAMANGVSEAHVEAARRSPVYRFVKEWRVALPLHPEARTLPMLFYVPPLSPIVGSLRRVVGDDKDATGNDDLGIDGHTMWPLAFEIGMPAIRYIANLFSAGDVSIIEEVYRRLLAVRVYTRIKRTRTSTTTAVEALSQAGLTANQAEEIARLTSRPTQDDRFVIPSLGAAAGTEYNLTFDPFTHRGSAGYRY